mgnify:CR=1 FL=1
MRTSAVPTHRAERGGHAEADTEARQVVERIQKNIGVDRVLYAMDYPYQYVKEEVDMMDALPLTPGQKKAFFQGNAERIFKL